MQRPIWLILTLMCAVSCSRGTITADAGESSDGNSSPDAGPLFDAHPPPENTAVYAHSSSELFSIDPDTLVKTSIGTFTFSGDSENITDIAVDSAGNMIGISLISVFSIDQDTAATSLLSTFSEGQGGLTSLSFVPVDINNPQSAERLVAADFDGVVWEIDSGTGARTEIGNYNVTGNAIGSSGDIVSVVGFGTFATVTIEGDDTDHLARIDPVTWQAIVLGDTGRDRIFGIGFWGGNIYGFTDNMEFITIDPATGQVTDSRTSSVSWWGAGVTTLAPVVN